MAKAQPHLIGFLKNWQSATTPFLQIEEVDDRYDYIIMAFATPANGTDYQITFTPEGMTNLEFTDQVHAAQDAGKKVLLSIGGATAPISLDNNVERDVFVTGMSGILYLYDFDGIDIDLEGSSLTVSGGSIEDPQDAPIYYLITAIRTLMEEHWYLTGKKMILTISPETAFVQGGQSAYNGVWGAYLPLIHALRDSIDVLQVQLYNSGSMYGIDGNIYEQGTADFIISQTEAVIQGFQTDGGFFEGLPANKIAVGLPACPDAAGGGYLPPEEVKAAMNYLLGSGPQPGAYTLLQDGGYPDLAGMMTWSINWDAKENCGDYYEYASVFEEIFSPISSTEEQLAFAKCYEVYPNPVADILHVEHCTPNNDPIGTMQVFDLLGRPVLEKQCEDQQGSFSIEQLPAGMYLLHVNNQLVEVFVKH